MELPDLERPPQGALSQIIAIPGMRVAGAVLFIIAYAEDGATSLLALYATKHFHVGTTAACIIQFGLAISMMTSQALVMPRLVQRVGECSTMSICAGVAIAGFILASAAPTVWVLFVAAPLVCIGFVVYSTVLTVISKLAPPHLVVTAMGFALGFSSAAKSTSPIIFGVLASKYNSWLHIDFEQIPFAFAGAAALLAAVVVEFGLRSVVKNAGL